MNLPVLPSNRGISRTDIEWADYAVGSPFRFRDKGTGQVYPTACVKVSAGCKNCYAESIGERFGTYLPYTKPNMDQLECFLDQGVIDHTLSFKPKPPKGETTFKNGRSRPAVFFTDTTDPFGDWVTFEQLDVLFACFALRPDVDFLLLTKRPERTSEYAHSRNLYGEWTDNIGHEAEHLFYKGLCSWDRVLSVHEMRGPLPNVWLGCSVEDQKTADERIPHLLKCPAAVRFVSYEPALGPVDFSGRGWLLDSDIDPNAMGGEHQLHWIIVGGESGKDARPFNVEWGRSVVRQCADAGVPCFVKQLGRFPGIDTIPLGRIEHATCMDMRGELCAVSRADDGDTYVLPARPLSSGWRAVKETPTDWMQCRRLNDRKGSDPSEWPADLRVRQVPGGAA